jgi:hypothetical protein
MADNRGGIAILDGLSPHRGVEAVSQGICRRRRSTGMPICFSAYEVVIADVCTTDYRDGSASVPGPEFPTRLIFRL